MSLLARFSAIDSEDKAHAIESLVTSSTPDFDFFFMMTMAVLMTTLGLLADSETVVIGSMLIAPLLFPLLGISLGLSMADYRLIARSGVTLVKAGVLAIAAAAIATLLFSFAYTADGAGAENAVVLARTHPSLLYLAVGIIAGLAVAYAQARPRLSAALPGVAISVALIPPLAVVGVGLAHLDLAVAFGALVMFLINVLGIVAASMIVFSLMNVREEQRAAQKAIVREDRRLEKEEAKVAAADVERALASVTEAPVLPADAPHGESAA
ncbi:MAG TPA: TIGR00341 family protein [Candidatus Paceibacterota bacterium]|nr:TIGR00341 family protein [Candidatus Paceibacterota bacterium]